MQMAIPTMRKKRNKWAQGGKNKTGEGRKCSPGGTFRRFEREGKWGKVVRTLNPHKNEKERNTYSSKNREKCSDGRGSRPNFDKLAFNFFGGRKEEMLYRPPRISYASFAPSTAARKLFPLFLFAVELRLIAYPHFPKCNVYADFFFSFSPSLTRRKFFGSTASILCGSL